MASLVKIVGSAKIQGKMVIAPPYTPPPVSDSDAEAYLQAVELADGRYLEESVRDPINDFVAGCKSDGIWDAIKASCVMAGARTYLGALVPLKGTAPTNINFDQTDYNRTTGLKGNGTTKNLISNRNNNADPQNSKHVSVYVSEPDVTLNERHYLCAGFSNGMTQITHNTALGILYRSNSQLAINTGDYKPTNVVGFNGSSRNLPSSWIARGNNANYSFTRSSFAPVNQLIGIFARGDNVVRSSGRLSFYSIGEHLDLAFLDTRVSNLMTAINTALA